MFGVDGMNDKKLLFMLCIICINGAVLGSVFTFWFVGWEHCPDWTIPTLITISAVSILISVIDYVKEM